MDTPATEREVQAEQMANRLGRRPPSAGSPIERSSELRGRVEEWSGVDLSHVHVGTGRRAGALGSTDGLDVTIDPAVASVAPIAEHVLLHEFVHAAQAEAAPTPEGRRLVRRPRPLQLFFCAGCNSDTDEATATTATAGAAKAAASPVDALGNKTVSAAEAEAALKFYEAADDAGRDAIVAKFHTAGSPSGALRAMIAALPEATQQAKRTVIDDLLKRIQRRTVTATTGKSIADLGKQQGTWRKSEAEKRAKAAAAAEAKKKGLPPPPKVSAADVAAADKKAVEDESIAKSTTSNWKNVLTQAQRDAWTKRATKAIAEVVKACNAKAPGLGITAANIVFDEGAIEARGASIMAFSGNPITVGIYFVEIAEADPEYAVGTVVHEITGHPEYDEGPEWDIHKESRKTFPTSADAQTQRDLYDYIGTEIHSVMREYEFYKPVTTAHRKAGIDDLDPTWIVTERLETLKSSYEPSIAEALVLGMWDRFRTDPRIVAASLTMLKQEITAVFPKLKLPT